ncbi:hypothetical protein AX17_006036 [Amanita inopinata Kibby_2008]|nr:hypothetical protein AX17_006036 [Amanita inopinata Kibby_2008]
MNVLFLAFLVLAFQLNAPTSLAALLKVSGPASPLSLIGRQNSSNGNDNGGDPVPQQCQQTCAPIIPFALGGQNCTADVCCSKQWEDSYVACITCAANAQMITDLSAAQHTLDTINADCASAGKPIPLLTLPGQPSNRTLPSASIAPSSGPSSTSNVSTPASSSSGNPRNAASANIPQSHLINVGVVTSMLVVVGLHLAF